MIRLLRLSAGLVALGLFLNNGFAVASDHSGTLLGQVTLPVRLPVSSPIVGPRQTLAIDQAPLARGQVGQYYEAMISASSSGPDDSYFWEVAEGTLPPGLDLHNGVCITTPCRLPVTISGIPTSEGTHRFTVRVSSGSQSDWAEFVIVISAGRQEGAMMLSLESPNGGEEWAKGSNVVISWQSSGISKVAIELWKGERRARYITWGYIVDDRSFIWQVPVYLPEGSDYKVVIRGIPGRAGQTSRLTRFVFDFLVISRAGRLPLSDESDGPFSIVGRSSPICQPRPACLDATPPCLIAEPAEGWCDIYPVPTVFPSRADTQIPVLLRPFDFLLRIFGR